MNPNFIDIETSFLPYSMLNIYSMSILINGLNNCVLWSLSISVFSTLNRRGT